ncbi:hypothetical protein F9Z43_25830 [Pseudomonas monteilii]|uniref:Uncharacterized protein n=1 Tax=Pseudomonas monteilii TaxID=76759 RepID=A0A7X3JU02_9PSED|nr:hypothetical protein [Pseudomonas monteilii]
MLAEHRVSPGSDRFLSWGTLALCGDVMTGRGGSDACARLAMARLRHSFFCCCWRPLRGQARSQRYGGDLKVCATPVGAGLPAKRPPPTTQNRACAQLV